MKFLLALNIRRLKILVGLILNCSVNREQTGGLLTSWHHYEAVWNCKAWMCVCSSLLSLGPFDWHGGPSGLWGVFDNPPTHHWVRTPERPDRVPSWWYWSALYTQRVPHTWPGSSRGRVRVSVCVFLVEMKSKILVFLILNHPEEPLNIQLYYYWPSWWMSKRVFSLKNVTFSWSKFSLSIHFFKTKPHISITGTLQILLSKISFNHGPISISHFINPWVSLCHSSVLERLKNTIKDWGKGMFTFINCPIIIQNSLETIF